jgi:Cd2+/Zn2+-exporting ATPase
VLPGWPRIAAALVLAVLAEAAHWGASLHPWLSYGGMALAVVAIGLSGLGVYKAGLKDLARFKLGIHALMAVAVTGAFLIGQWPEAAMVMALYAAAERIEDQAMDRARRPSATCCSWPRRPPMCCSPTAARRTAVARWPWVRAAHAPGARVPLDGPWCRVKAASTRPHHGESALADKARATSCLPAPSTSTAADLRVTAPATDSLLARIVHAVEQAQASARPPSALSTALPGLHPHRAGAGRAAGRAGAPWLLGWTWHGRLPGPGPAGHRLPCALVLSTPVTVVSALTRRAARHSDQRRRSLETARQLRAVRWTRPAR